MSEMEGKEKILIAPKRLRYLDIYRGIIIALMIFSNFFLPFANTPSFLKHATGENFINIPDVGFPLFLFIFGISYAISFERNKNIKFGKLIFKYLIRAFVLLALGIVLNILLSKAWLAFNVLVIFAIGSVVLFPVLYLSRRLQLFLAFLIIILYQFLVWPIFQTEIVSHPLGAYWGLLAWLGIGVFGIALEKYIPRSEHFIGKTRLIFLMLACLIFTFVLLLFEPISRVQLTGAYVFFTLFLGILFIFVAVFFEKFNNIMKIFEVFGQNSLVAYTVSFSVSIVLSNSLSPSIPMWMILLLSGALFVLTFSVSYVAHNIRK